MPAQSSADENRRNKILSYLEEGCLSFGILTGGVVGLHVAASNLSYAVNGSRAIYSVLAGAHIGLMIGVTATYTLPIIAKSLLPRHIDDDLTIRDLFTTHHHKPSRLMGLATGIGLSLALTWNGVSAMAGKPINIEPVIVASQDFFRAVTESRTTQVADLQGFQTIQLYPPGSVPFTVSYREPAGSLALRQADNLLTP